MYQLIIVPNAPIVQLTGKCGSGKLRKIVCLDEPKSSGYFRRLLPDVGRGFVPSEGVRETLHDVSWWSESPDGSAKFVCC